MICSNCHAVLEEGALFCANCGKRVEMPQPGSVFCMNCGERLAAGAHFCPNCGTQQGQTAQPGGTGRKGSRKMWIMIGGVAAAVVLAAVLLITGVFQSPAAKFRAVLERTIVAPARTAAKALVVPAKGEMELSTDMTMRVEIAGAQGIAEYFKDTSIGLKVDGGKNGLLAEVSLRLMGSDVLSGIISLKDGTAGLYVPELDERYYTIHMATLMEKISSGSSQEPEEKQYEMTEKMLDSLSKRYSKILLSCIRADNVTKNGGETVKLEGLGEERKNCAIYTFEPSKEDLKVMLLALADEMREDEEMVQFFMAFPVQDYLVPTTSIYYEESVVDLYENIESEDEIREYLASFADELTQNAESIAEELVEGGFRWMMALKGNELVKMQISLWEETIALELYGTERKGQDICLSVSEPEDSVPQVRLKLGYTKTGRKLNATASYYHYDSLEGQASVDVDLTKKSALGVYYGTYKLVSGAEELVTLSVGKGETGSRHELKIGYRYLQRLYYAIGADSVSLIVDTTDKKSTVKAPPVEPTDISDYDEDELRAIVSDWADELGTLLYGVAY